MQELLLASFGVLAYPHLLVPLRVVGGDKNQNER